MDLQTSMPVTPSGKSHKEIDHIVRKLAINHDIALPDRQNEWSPSKSKPNVPETCYSCIKYLFFVDKNSLNRAIADFEESVITVDSHEQRLKKLLNSLQTERWIVRNTVRPAFSWKKRSAEFREQTSNLNSRNTSLTKHLAKAPNPQQSHEFSEAKFQVNRLPSCRPSAGNTEEISMGDDADDDYTTPPQSPTPDNRVAEPLPRQKRRSHEMLKDEISPKQRKVLGIQGRASLHRIDSAVNTRTEKSIWNTIREPIRSASTSFASTTNTSCASSVKQQGKSSTACTSFNTDETDVDQKEVLGHNFRSSDTFSLDDETIHQHFKSHERHMNDPAMVSNLDLNRTKTQETSQFLNSVRIPSPQKPVAKQNNSEQHQVRNLPNAGLFVHEENSIKSHVAFNIRYECARVALSNDLCCSSLIPESASDDISYGTLWDNMQKVSNQSLKMPELCSVAAWTAAQEGFNNISLRAKISFNMINSGPLFKLYPEPMQIEPSCRFQRKFGGDRFLFLEVPVFNAASMPINLKDQYENLKARFLEWLKVKKDFLGRKWSAFHYSTKSKRSSLKKSQTKLQRVILFATEGDGIPHITIDELVNWFISLKNKPANRNLPYCKAYSRLDLGLSRTVPTIVFRPSQLRKINNTLADGTSEMADFNDQKLEWPELHHLSRPQVMNDGCARISVGAAIAVWAKLKKSGPVPSVFQARIGGCKGLWIASASTSTNDPEHNEIWIEVAPSQRKFEPHTEDEYDSTFDPNRLTFEVVDYSRPLSRDKLHVDFLPILENRGVRFANLADITQMALNQEKLQLFEALDNPVNFRKWINEHYQLADVTKKRGDYRWMAGMPSFLGDRINFLLEAGFDPKSFRFLADLTHQFVRSNYGTEMSRKFHISMARTTSVMGIADPLGILEPGQIHLSFSRGFYDEVSGESYPCLDRKEALVARHPTLRSSDMQKVRAVYKSELGHLSDVVIFPSKGTYPLAAKLQGGDYDGDTFWICWEPQVTSTFQNAPPPVDISTPQALGINVDTRLVRDLTDGHSVEPFLFAGMDFKLNPDLLGIATVMHGKVAYLENSISTPAVGLLADLHDYLVDSAKNGFLFGSEDYSRFVSKLPGVPLKALREPAYKEAMNCSAKDDNGFNSRSETIKYKKNHINDFIYFEVMSPHVNEVLNMLLEIRDKCSTYDHDLTAYFNKAVNETEDVFVRAELEHLARGLDSLYKRLWTQNVHRNFGDCLENCFKEYREISPLNTDHSAIRYWMRKDLVGIPSQWELLKASCLFKIFHAKFQFCFGMAGRQLAFIKASSSQGIHFMVSSMWANSKAKKALEVAAAKDGTGYVDNGQDTFVEESDSDFGEYMTAPDTNVYADIEMY